MRTRTALVTTLACLAAAWQLPAQGSALETQRQRVDDLGQQILRLDRRIESSVEQAVKLLSSTTDSAESRTRIANAKQEALEGLRRSLEVYVGEREKRMRALQNKVLPDREDLVRDVGSLDDRIEKRIEQIIAVARSFSDSSGLREYERYRYTYRRAGPARGRSRNTRDGNSGERTRREIVDDLNKAIDALLQQQVRAERKLRPGTAPGERELVQAEIERIDGLVARRREQIASLLEPSNPATDAVSRNRARTIEESLDSLTGTLEKDIETLVLLKTQYDRERRRLRKVEPAGDQ